MTLSPGGSVRIVMSTGAGAVVTEISVLNSLCTVLGLKYSGSVTVRITR